MCRRSTGTAVAMGIMTRRAMGNHVNGSRRRGRQNSNIRVHGGPIQAPITIMRARGALQIQTMLRARPSIHHVKMKDMGGQSPASSMQMSTITGRRPGRTRESTTRWTIEVFKNSGKLEQRKSSTIQRRQQMKAETTSPVGIFSNSSSTSMLLCFKCKKYRNLERNTTRPRKATKNIHTTAKRMKIQHAYRVAQLTTSATI